MNLTAGKAKLTATIAGGLVLIAIGTSTVANAQVISSFRDLAGSVKEGERLTITEQSGVITKGRFAGLADQRLRVMADSGRLIDLSEASVAKIDRLRSRRGKGALVGFVTGFVGGLLAVALTPESGSSVGPSKGTVILPLAAIFGGIGAGIGAGVGAMRPDHRLIYLAPGAPPKTPPVQDAHENGIDRVPASLATVSVFSANETLALCTVNDLQRVLCREGGPNGTSPTGFEPVFWP
jgi:hypothetical protein